MHNPNPFDFVPFTEKPILKTEAEFNALGDLYSGYLEVKLKALTPVHVVGFQEPVGEGRKSHIYRQNGQACIPAASIRGCLRSFIEALTAGWVSQANVEYKKEYGLNNPKGRHVGFSTFEKHRSRGMGPTYHMDAAVNPVYRPQAMEGENPLLDVASYLFGIVVEKEKGEQVGHDALARKSRVWVEDAQIQPDQIESSRYWLPDITGEAFMGGAKPSASNWWYMQPREVWARRVTAFIKGQKRTMSVAEFIGEKYWGRKFYYHQDPEKCVKYYDPREGNWPYRDVNAFCKVVLECLKPQAETDTFRIYVNRLPRQLLMMLVLSLLPGKNIRHKLGYGKAYGYGSVAFSIAGANLRVEEGTQRIPSPLQDRLAGIIQWAEAAWSQERMQAIGFDISLINWQALEKLAQVLGWANSEQLIFTYPPFKTGYFARGIGKKDFNDAVQPDYKLEQPIKTSPENARSIAAKLFDVKKPIHFRLYQERAEGWAIIKSRRP
ncbi:MAG: RAMP superfamily CRISPR-associated protein [Chloroflexota bacterium]